MVRLRKTSPQEQWKKFGIVPRIFPCVPLPEPGAPKSKNVRYFIKASSDFETLVEKIAASSCVFGADLNFHDLGERDHFFGRRMILKRFQKKLGLRDTHDAFAAKFTPRCLDGQHHASFRFAR